MFTDPGRSGELEALARALPRGSALVYRSFGAPDAAAVAWRLARTAHARGAKLLAGADPALARAAGADGVHLPERDAGRAGVLKRRRPGWINGSASLLDGPIGTRLDSAA